MATKKQKDLRKHTTARAARALRKRGQHILANAMMKILGADPRREQLAMLDLELSDAFKDISKIMDAIKGVVDIMGGTGKSPLPDAGARAQATRHYKKVYSSWGAITKELVALRRLLQKAGM